MPALITDREYIPGQIFTAAMVDEFLNSIELFTNTTRLDSTNIQSSGIVTTNLASGTITYDLLAQSVVDGHTLKLTAAGIGVIAASITGALLGTGAVTTASIVDANITRPLLASVNAAVSLSCGSYSTISATAAQITNLSVTITTNGRPVVLGMTYDGVGSLAVSGNGSALGFSPWSNSTPIQLIRNATTYVNVVCADANPDLLSPACLNCVDVVSAGTYTYTVFTRGGGSSGQLTRANSMVLYAYEM